MKLRPIIPFIFVFISLILHLITMESPYFHEDESIYLSFSLQGPPDFQNGIFWQIIGKLIMGFEWIVGLKAIPLLFGLVVMACLFHASANLESKLLLVGFSLSPVAFSQFHRFRPEALHAAFGTAALFFFILAFGQSEIIEKNRPSSVVEPKRELGNAQRRFTQYLTLGILFMIAVPHTHIMAIFHLPGLAIILIYLVFKQVRRPVVVLAGIAILFLAVFFFFQPILREQGLGYLKGLSNSQIPISVDMKWHTPFEIIGENARVWYSDVTTRMPFFSRGQHLKIHIEVLMFFFFSGVAIQLIILARKYIKKEAFCNFNVVLQNACALNVLSFIFSIFLFKRINNSYLLVLELWLFAYFIFFVQSDEYAKITRKLKFISGLVFMVNVGLIFFNLLHFRIMIYPHRHSNFVKNLNVLKESLASASCSEKKFVSAPYFPFFAAIDSGDLSKINDDPNKLIPMLQQIPSKGCIAIHARHLWGFEFFSQFKMELLRKLLLKNFDQVALLELPFYDEKYFYKKTNGLITLPVGADYIYYNGKEILSVFRKKDTAWQE